MIGIFGGTFDPVHYGHIKPALDVKRALSLTELRFIPCSIPAHRDEPVATAAQRLSMLRAALSEYEGCVIDERELERSGVSYMVDTLQSLRNEFPDEALCLIIGMDAFYGLHKWSRWQTIFELAGCVVTYRPGCELDFDMLAEELKILLQSRQVKTVQEFVDSTNNALLFLPVTQLDISATDIRKRISKDQPTNDMLPLMVKQIIDKQQIYTG